MKRTAVAVKAFSEQEMRFERERLLNLINSKIQRREMDVAKGFAEELFDAEVEFALLRKTKRLKRYSSIMLKVMLAFIGVLFVSVACMVLNINPSFHLMTQLCSLLAIISLILLNALLVRRFEYGVRMIVDAYETVKKSFAERVISSLMDCGRADVTLEHFGLI
jgi:hypothetical protein